MASRGRVYTVQPPFRPTKKSQSSNSPLLQGLVLLMDAQQHVELVSLDLTDQTADIGGVKSR